MLKLKTIILFLYILKCFCRFVSELVSNFTSLVRKKDGTNKETEEILSFTVARHSSGSALNFMRIQHLQTVSRIRNELDHRVRIRAGQMDWI
jgi:hypothetical protein